MTEKQFEQLIEIMTKLLDVSIKNAKTIERIERGVGNVETAVSSVETALLTDD